MLSEMFFFSEFFHFLHHRFTLQYIYGHERPWFIHFDIVYHLCRAAMQQQQQAVHCFCLHFTCSRYLIVHNDRITYFSRDTNIDFSTFDSSGWVFDKSESLLLLASGGFEHLNSTRSRNLFCSTWKCINNDFCLNEFISIVLYILSLNQSRQSYYYTGIRIYWKAVQKYHSLFHSIFLINR